MADRRMNMAETIFDGYRLRPTSLHIFFAAPQTGEQIGRLAIEQMTTVQFGGDLDGQPHPLPGGFDPRLIRDGAQKIATQADKSLHSIVQ